MNKPLFPAQQWFPSCFVPFSASILLVVSQIVSAFPSNLRMGLRALETSLEMPWRALGEGSGSTQRLG